MVKNIRNWIVALLFVTVSGGAALTLATPQTTHAACNDTLLTLPAWHQGLTDGNCNIKNPADVGGLPNFIWKIGFNVLDAMLQIVGYVCVGFIITGGFKYMTSSGSTDGMAKARTTILNAVIGLLIAIFSVAIVNLVSGAIK